MQALLHTPGAGVSGMDKFAQRMGTAYVRVSKAYVCGEGGYIVEDHRHQISHFHATAHTVGTGKRNRFLRGEGGGGKPSSCMAGILRPSILACLQYRDGGGGCD